MILFDKLCKLRLLAAVLYDQGTAAGLTSNQILESIHPVREQTKALIHEAIKNHLDEAICAVYSYEELAKLDESRAKRYQEKAQEAFSHAEQIKEALKKHLLEQGKTQAMHGNYMVTLVDGKVELR